MNRVIVIGGGIAGLSASLDLADLHHHVTIIENSDFIGGHGIRFACKAANRCVRCGACMVVHKLENVCNHPYIKIFSGSDIRRIDKSSHFSVAFHQRPTFIDSSRCTGCGLCSENCPEKGAIIAGHSHHNPFYSISRSKCLRGSGAPCTICEAECPENAIDLDATGTDHKIEGDAIIAATGFKPFSPESKPYGYGKFQNTMTNLKLEGMLQKTGDIRKPSDGAVPGKIAFVQCVGSRDTGLGHGWCSQVCCGSAIRMAGKIRQMHPETEITIFHIDIQSFGRDFDTYMNEIKDTIRWIRTIPADIIETDRRRLQVSYYDTEAVEEDFDLVVLSVGLTPNDENVGLMQQLQFTPPDNRQSNYYEKPGTSFGAGIFGAGSIMNPMGIADSVASASDAVLKVLRYLENGKGPGK